MSDQKRTVEKPITIGSADVYIQEFEGTLPAVDDICVEANRFCYTKNGATIRYTQTAQTISDDLGRIRKTVYSGDEATVQLGVLGWIGTTLEKAISTASVSTRTQGEGAAANRRVTKIGGVGNDNGKRYVVCLHHTDKQDGDCWWMLVGKNTEGLELQYQVEDGTVFQPTFTAEPYDNDGHLLWFEEEIVGGATGTGTGTNAG